MSDKEDDLCAPQDVVWERLCAVNGDTEFVRADFSSFKGQSVTEDALTAANLAQAAFSGMVPASGELPSVSVVEGCWVKSVVDGHMLGMHVSS